MKKVLLFFTFLFFLVFVVEAQLNINHFIRVGKTRIAIGNYTGAIEYFNIVIEFKPYLPEAYLHRGIAKHSLEDYRGAILDYDEAIKIKPFYPKAYNNRGMAFHNLKNYKAAIENYNRALEFDPNDENIYSNRGLAKLALKNLEGAIEDYNRSLEINPKSTHALMKRSNAKIVSGDIKGAISDLNKVIVIRPHYADAYLNRGLARLELEDYASALRDFDQSIKLDKKNALAFNNRGIVKQKLGDYNSAAMDYTMAISLDPGMASAYFNRGMAREILKQTGYQRDYQIAAQLNPHFDLNKRRLNAEKLAQKQNSSKTKQVPTNTNTQNNTKPKINNALAQADIDKKKKEEFEARKRKRRSQMDLAVEETRELPKEDADTEDGRIQDKNIVIDLQPPFQIVAFEKNTVDYDRFQYYNAIIDKLNTKNNYNPLLSISNKLATTYLPVFENFILFFNEKIKIQDNAHNYLNRGIFNSLTGNYNDALSDLNKVIALKKETPMAYFTRANNRYKMQEQIELSTGTQPNIAIPMQQTERNSKTPNVNNAISLDYQQILQDYETTLFMAPEFFFGYYNRAYIKLRLGKYKSAIEDLNRAIELEPKFAEAYFNRGLTKIFLDDIEGGALDLSRAGELGIQGAYNIIKRYCN